MPLDMAKFIRKTVELVDTYTSTLKSAVTFSPWMGITDAGDITWGDPVTLTAIVNTKQYNLYENGQLKVVMSTIKFLYDIEDTIGNPLRDNPFDMKDSFTLQDGTTGPVIGIIPGTIDPQTGRGFKYIVLLGAA